MTPTELAETLQNFTAEYFSNNALSRVPDNIDKRQGSIIFDAIAPSAASYEELALNMQNIVLQAFVETATDEFLDYHAQQKGTGRKLATFAKVNATFLDDNGQSVGIEVGDRFATPTADAVFFTVSQVTGLGAAVLTAETAGTSGNGYIGQILPVTPNDQVSSAQIVEINIPARDDETDDDLRARLLSTNESTRYGGNVADYIDMVSKLETTGAVQVYPAWNGGGTVRLVILDNQFNLPTQALLDSVKNTIDPVQNQGLGYGLAPIGHTVTVAAPSAKTVNIVLNITTLSGSNMDTIKANINVALNNYFLGLRKKWDTAVNIRTYSETVYRAAIIGELIKIDGVINIPSITLNGSNNDVVLTFNNNLQEVPMLGTVAING